MHKLLIVLILFFFIGTACQPAVTPTPAVKKPTQVPATKPAPVVEPPASGGGAAAAPILTGDSLNTVPPEDIIQEIGYFGGAGGRGEVCYDVGQGDPILWGVRQEPSALMEYVKTYVCNLQNGEPVEVRVEKPNGEIVEARVSAVVDLGPSGYAEYDYLPLAEDPIGTYTFTFSGAAWSSEYTHTITEPESARLYQYESNLYFLGFAPNEHVRLLVYGSPDSPTPFVSQSTFQGWTQIQMDSNGKKHVELKIDSASYVAIGERSGEVNERVADPDFIGEPFSIYCEAVAKPVGLVPNGYAEVLVDSLPVYEFNTATSHWEQTGELPIGKGSIVQINSNGRCGDDSYLWLIICTDTRCNQVVPESGVGGPYLHPLQSAPAARGSGSSEVPACPGTQPTRLEVGMNAEVTTSGMASQLSLRAGASMSAEKVHVIAAGRDLVILKGPVCADNSYWWYIRSEQGFEGWAREGDNEDYWIDPLP